MANNTAKCFISYSHKDKDMCEKFLKHFNCLSHLVDTEIWYDGMIPVGGEIDDEIKRNLNSSDVIFLLISTDFINSHYCYEKELKTAIKRHKKGECVVIPIIIHAYTHGEYPFSKLKFVPTDGRPIDNFKPHDNGFVDAFGAIKSLLQEFTKNNKKTKPLKATGTKSTVSTDKLPKYTAISNGKLKSRNLNDDIFRKVLLYNDALPAFVSDVISVTKDSYETLCKKMSDKKISSQNKIYWQRRCMEDFLFQMSTYLQQHFIGTDNTCVHFRVCKTSTYNDYSEVGYNNVGLPKEPITALNGMIEAAFNNNHPVIKSNNLDLHKKSHPNEAIQRDYITCFLDTVYKTYDIKLSLCLSIVGRHTVDIRNSLTALSIIRIDRLVDRLVNHYISLCVDEDIKYDVKKIFDK